AYVAFIGFPDAACRSAIILTFAVLARARGRPTERWGATSAALLVLVAHDPARIATPGFQLSFAGAAGLVAWAGPLGRVVQRAFRGKCPQEIALAVGGGIGATAATLPIVAWHFEQVSLVGVPATLVATPLVT